ncbi:hypothetical protein AURDEDRAFT_158137 [Auricularia subglabra TFB-10046 SS5]|nr:hypothetical protein AURDEDRAFT_158137 [Auricularia subglabra TFB-10046 SS5]
MADYVKSVLDPLANVPSLEAPGRLALEVVLADDKIHSAHDRFLRSLKRNELRKTSSGPVVQLLNRISVMYFKNFQPDTAVIFASSSSVPIPGDYLTLDKKPNVYGFLGTQPALIDACDRPDYHSLQPWSTIVSVGQLKRRQKHKRPTTSPAPGQLKACLAGVKRYRPDLRAVHGFCLESGSIWLAKMNPGGRRESDDVPWTELSPWIAHVVQVYTSLKERDPDIQYCAEQTQFPRWDIRKNGIGLAVTPFHVGHAPGRTTFACFEVGRLPADSPGTGADLLADLEKRFDSGIVEGFWKISWQPTTSGPTEAELLSRLHKDGWVPGLVRHYPESTLRDDSASAEHNSRGDDGLVKDILHLGSIGQPLSQCETAEDLLDCMYDLIESASLIPEFACLGIIHRDLSYFNVLCKPRHYIAIHPLFNYERVLQRPCIRKILGDPTGQPCVLLTDLDHATPLDKLAIEPVPEEHIGTPMFMSVRLENLKTSSSVRWRNQSRRIQRLFDVLQVVEADQDVFRRAFPDGNGDFISRLKRVVEAEDKKFRENTSDPGPTPLRHDWRHDAESIHWAFLWAFTRARPQNADDALDMGRIDGLCLAMLTTSMKDTRPPWLASGRPYDLFAYELEPFESLFQEMATYLSIPWHLYCGEGGIMEDCHDHVHIAFRRLILRFKLDPDNADALHVRLDTASPRITTVFDNAIAESAASIDKGLDDSSTCPEETPVTPAMKRKAEEEAAAILNDDPGRSAKRIKVSETLAVSARPVAKLSERPGYRDHVQKTSDAKAVDDQLDKELDKEDALPEEEPTERYDPSVHCHALSAQALRQMFWKDRALWFGRGTY